MPSDLCKTGAGRVYRKRTESNRVSNGVLAAGGLMLIVIRLTLGTVRKTRLIDGRRGSFARKMGVGSGFPALEPAGHLSI
jgi:hypothetical protein